MLAFLAIGLIFLLVPITYLLRRWRGVPCLLAAVVSGGLGATMAIVPLDRVFTLAGREFVVGGTTVLLGRSVVFGPLAQTGLTFLFLAGAALFLLAWPLGASEPFVPVGLGGVGLLAAALVVRPLVYAILILELAVAVLVLILRNKVGGAHYLTFFVLALPGPLIAHWLLDMYALTPDQAGLLRTASMLIGLSFALMLGLVPFHPWVPALGRGESPLSIALIFSAVGGTVWFLLLDYLQTYPWVSQSPYWLPALTAMGVGTVVIGGLMGAAPRGWGALLGYAVMVDTGMLTLALIQAGTLGVELERAMMLTRVWGVITAAGGLAAVGVGGFPLRGRRSAWGAVALMVGLLTLAGFPPTVGFASRWGLYRLLFRDQPVTALVLLVSSFGPVVGLLRMLPASLAMEASESRGPVPLADLLLALMAVGAIGLGLFPQILIYR